MARLRLRVALRVAAIGLVASVGIGPQSGCAPPLLAEYDPRSPFDAHDAARNQWVPPKRTDSYGRSRPNIRGRLAPKD